MDHNDLKLSEFNKIVGQRILKQRLGQKLTQSKLAKKLFVTFQQVQKYEKGINGVSGLEPQDKQLDTKKEI